MLDLHLFLGRAPSIVTVHNGKQITGDGHFGKIPQILVEEELGELIQWSQTSVDVVSKLLY